MCFKIVSETKFCLIFIKSRQSITHSCPGTVCFFYVGEIHWYKYLRYLCIFSSHMKTQIFFRVLQFICICSLLICLRLYRHSEKLLSNEKAWVCFRLITLPCSECAVFNIVYYSNGTITFHGINNTAYIGKKMFQLEINRMIAVKKFVRRHSFVSDLQSRRILFRIEYSQNMNEVYFWNYDSLNYTSLITLLTIERLSSYKRWSVLLRTAYMREKYAQQRFKRFIDNYIPIQTSSFITISSQVTIYTSDLVDACLSTNNIIGDNQFYPLRDQFIWLNEVIDLQGKCGF
jgi:hypothetical protein